MAWPGSAFRIAVVATPLLVTIGGAQSNQLQASLGYATLQIDVNQPFANAITRPVALTVNFAGTGEVASVQVSGLAYPTGPRSGSFQHTFEQADLRSLLRSDEPAIMTHCRSVLDYNQSDSIDTAHDTRLRVSVNGPGGAVVASTDLPYQVGLRCRRIPPLAVTVGFGKIDLNVNGELARAKASSVPLTVKYNGTGSVASVQVQGAISYRVGPHAGSFQQTIPGVDLRQIVKGDEAAMVERCRRVLEHNKVSVIETAWDTKLPVTVNGPDGAVVASTTVPYQLGLTCRR